ncbi:MAG: hypothetical protein H6619_03025 [Deltaproteobacteria bacterium]|nr:hypothetical protein [Deltaproteobacteria bacterium]
MKKLLQLLVLAMSIFTLTTPSFSQNDDPPSYEAGDDVPCLNNGEAVEVKFHRPAIDADGMPVTASWKMGTGVPQAWEKDSWTDNDKMGRVSFDPETEIATVPLRNDNGSIEGPNGVDVEYGDGCVEVYVVWYYRYTFTRTTTVTNSQSISAGGDSGGTTSTNTNSTSIQVTVHATSWVRPEYDEPTIVCPC